MGQSRGMKGFSNGGVRTLSFLIWVLGTNCALPAQSIQGSWQNLSGLQAGQKIEVLEANSKKVSGHFLSVSEAGITLQEGAGSQMVEKQDVLRVRLMKNKHRLRNTLIGAGIGAGTGAVIGGAWNNGFFPRGLAAGVLATVFLVPGAVVGVLVPSNETIYRVGSVFEFGGRLNEPQVPCAALRSA
jgi:hypothetical protein